MKTPPISSRASLTPPSPIRKLAPLAQRAQTEGVRVYHLNIGQPDIKTPEDFYRGLHVHSPRVLAYEQSQGLLDLRQSWCDYLQRSLQAELNPDQMLINSGASEALVFAFMMICDPGDEVLIFDPSYANYIGFAAIAGVRLVPIRTEIADNFALPSTEAIRAHINQRTKAILICNPNNPTGTVYPTERLKDLLQLCEEFNLYLVADETYREFVYDGQRCFSLLEITKQHPNVMVIDSLSKRFSLCGARIGCLISQHRGIQQAALNLAQARLSVATLEQLAAAYLLRNVSADFISGVRKEYEGRRNTLLSALRRIPAVRAETPHGAFYTLVELPVNDAEQFASFMLREFRSDNETVFVAPALGFYLDSSRGKNQVRIAYVLESGALERAVEILGQGLEAYPNRI